MIDAEMKGGKTPAFPALYLSDNFGNTHESDVQGTTEPLRELDEWLALLASWKRFN